MIQLSIDNNEPVAFERKGENISFNGELLDYDLQRKSNGDLLITFKNKVYEVQLLDRSEKMLQLSINGRNAELKISDHIDQVLAKLGMDTMTSTKVSEIKAPMPGTILSVGVEAGQQVTAGDQIIILEAMKMENVIKSEGDGVIAKVHVAPGESVEKNHLLVSFE